MKKDPYRGAPDDVNVGDKMFMSLGPGQLNYLPDNLVGLSQDGADLSSIAFFQCYVADLLQWEAICFFAGHAEEWYYALALSCALHVCLEQVLRCVANLSRLQLLEEQILAMGCKYRLTRQPALRRAVLRSSSEWLWTPVLYTSAADPAARSE